ncbi:MAG: hypothetical protein ABII82_18410 [Verrucomicrobiota bacterium]
MEQPPVPRRRRRRTLKPEPAPGPRLNLNWKQLLVGGGVLLFVLYFGGALAMARWYARTPHNRIGYLDLVLPTRWADISGLRGRALLDQSREDFAAGNFQYGFAKLRAGLGQAPDQASERLALARIYLLMRLPVQTEQTLFAGLRAGYPGVDYFTDALKTLDEMDNPESVLDFAQKASALVATRRPDDHAARELLHLRAIDALLGLGHVEDALQRARSGTPRNPGLEKTIELRMFLDEGRKQDAHRLLADWLRDEPKSKTALTKAVSVYRDTGAVDLMQDALRRLADLDPVNPALAARAVVENRAAAQDPAADAALEHYLFFFGATPANIYNLGHLCADRGHTADIDRLEVHAREHGFNPRPLHLAKIKSHRLNHDWPAMERQAAGFATLHPNASAKELQWVEIMRLLAAVCGGDTSGVNARLNQLAFERPGSIDLHQSILDPLLAADRLDEAGQILALASGMYPKSQYLARVREELRTRAELRDRLAEQARADTPAPAQVTAADIRREVDALFAGDEPGKALLALRRARRQHPALLPPSDPWAARQEITLAEANDDLALLQLYLRDHLKGAAITPDAALALAVDWRTHGRKATALFALQTIVQAAPDHAESLRLLSEWTPRPEPAADAADPAAPPADDPAGADVGADANR